MKRIVFSIVPCDDGGWLIKHGPFSMLERWHRMKSSALGIAAAKGRALRDAGKLAQLVIHGKDGRIQSERTYGKDPRRTPG